MACEYIYLLQEREFLKTNEPIYKLGRTQKEHHKRFHQYPKGSVLLFQIICENSAKLEKVILKAFKQQFKIRKDIGNEYFEGIYYDMINCIYHIVHSSYSTSHNKKNKKEFYEPVKPNALQYIDYVVQLPIEKVFLEIDKDNIKYDAKENKIYIPSTIMYNHYREWCIEHDEKIPTPNNKFYDVIKKHSNVLEKKRMSKKKTTNIILSMMKNQSNTKLYKTVSSHNTLIKQKQKKKLLERFIHYKRNF